MFFSPVTLKNRECFHSGNIYATDCFQMAHGDQVKVGQAG